MIRLSEVERFHDELIAYVLDEMTGALARAEHDPAAQDRADTAMAIVEWIHHSKARLEQDA